MLPPESNLARVQWALSALTLVLALVLGGGQGTLGDTLCQLLGIGLVGLALFRHRHEAAARLPRLAWITAIPLSLPLLQLMPLPDFLWTATAAREALSTQLASVGVAHDPRLSLVPIATERALFWLLPGVGIFLSALQWRKRWQAGLLGLFVVVAIVSTFLGLAQLTAGPDSPLRFYSITNPNSAVGFFANRNHFAMLLVMALPFVVVGTAAAATTRQRSREALVLRIIAGVVIGVLLILGVAMAGSRAGILLGGLALALSAAAVVVLQGSPGKRRQLALVLATGLVAAAGIAGLGVAGRDHGEATASADSPEDGRLHYAAVALRAASEHAPFGTGLGGFRRAYEAKDLETPLNVYVNHAHSDPVELWVEAGWLAPLLVLALSLALLAGGRQAWRLRHARGRSAWIRQAAWISLLVVLLHSLVDYPLRTTAHIALAGLLAACLVRRDTPAAPLPG